MLKIGDRVPSLTLKDQNGEEVSLDEFKNRKPLVIYFYPKDNTRVCTAQACGFRDHYEDFKELGAEVIGISKDSVESHSQVTSKRNLPFILLSDPKKEAHKAFQVPTYLFGLLSGRVTFITDKHGMIIHTFTANFEADSHIQEALNKLRAL